MISKGDRMKNLKEETIPVGFIKNGFISINNKPGPFCYENYLIEFLNKSNFFTKTKGAQFEKVKDESHGEPDAIALQGGYEIDFKLILGKSMQQVKDLTEGQINTDGNGIVYHSASKGQGKYQAYWLHRALRDYPKEELEIMLDTGIHTSDRLENDIISFLKSILKEKNLFLLYPALLWYEGEEVIEENDIFAALYDDYKNALDIRRDRFPDKETFVATFFEKHLIIGEYTLEGIKCVDKVLTKASDTFVKIADYYSLNTLVRKLI